MKTPETAEPNHFEKNKRGIALAPKIKREAQAKGMEPLELVMVDPAYGLNGVEASGFAACYTEVCDAYAETPNPTYSNVIRHPKSQNLARVLTRVSRMAAAFKPDFADDMGVAAIAQFNVCYQMKNYDRHGRHCYVVSEGLATLLALTELRGLKCEDLHLPFPVVYLQTPKGLGFRIFNVLTGWHSVEGLYISEDTTDSGRNFGLLNDREPDGGRSWRICVVGAPNEKSVHTLDDALVYFTIPLVEGWDVDQSLEDLARRIHANASIDPGIRDDSDERVKEWLAIFRWALNVMVYATTPDAEHETVRGNTDAESIWRRIQKLPKGKKREELNARLRGLDPMNRTVLGKSVKLTPNLREMLEHKKTGKGKALMVRTLVSGHWQRYAVGEGRKDRTWKFRQPFWRGPVDAPVAESHEHRME